MSITTQNKDIFASQTNEYSNFYLRSDEVNIVNKYFTKQAARVLIVGCGAGRTIPFFYKKGFDVTAIDIVPEMVESARRNMAQRSIAVPILEMDATDLKFPDATFDYIFFPFHGIDFVTPSIFDAVKEFYRVLQPGGVCICNSHNRYYFKKLHRFFAGKHDFYHGIRTYRTDLSDIKKFKAIFRRVYVHQRISLIDHASLNWKDKLYALMPFFNKSTYFVGCK